MPDQTARDAVKRGLLDAFRGAWTDSEYEATFGPAADAVLAALGIPPEMATSEISAALTLLDHMTATVDRRRPEPPQHERRVRRQRRRTRMGIRRVPSGGDPRAQREARAVA